MKIAFLNRSLEVGGAQVQMAVLAKGLQARGHDITVFTFYSGGRIAEELTAAGVSVVSLNKRGRWDIFGFVIRMVRSIRKLNPDILHGYLPVPNLMCAFLRRDQRRGMRIVWGIRASHRDLSSYDWTWRLVDRLESEISFLPDLVICNSVAGKDRCVERKFRTRRIEVVHNGVDTDRFQRNDVGRERLRAEWGITEGQVVVGIVGRLDPVKMHERFLRAAKTLKEKGVDCVPVVVGSGSDPLFVKALHDFAEDQKLNVVWGSERSDLDAVYSAFDITVCCSSSEGFPNVAAESMACGTPVVGTRVGDLEHIVHDPDLLVDNSDNGAGIAVAITQFLAGEQPGPDALRELITRRYSVERMVEQTESLLCGLR